MLLLVQICVIKVVIDDVSRRLLFYIPGQVRANVGFLFGNGHAGSSEEHRPDDEWWHSVTTTYRKHLKPFEQTANPVMFLMRNPRLSASLSEALIAHLFLHYESLRMKTSSAKYRSNNTPRAHWRKYRTVPIYLIWVHLHRLRQRANSHLLINFSFGAVIQYKASGRFLLFMTCVFLWCICHTDYCSAVRQKAFFITVTFIWASNETCICS